MTEPPTWDELQRERQKREAHWDPAERWRVIQNMIAWADAQSTGGRNTKQRCLQLQREKLRNMQ
jgi:hypothetical protein